MSRSAPRSTSASPQVADPSGLAWHYTDGRTTELIWRSEVLHPLGAAWQLAAPLLAGANAAVRPVVWFTLSSTFEPTALCLTGRDGRALSFARLVARLDREAMGAWRFGVDPSRVPMSWEDYERTSGDEQCAALKATALSMGSNLDLWRATFDGVRLEEWKRVECFRAGRWVDVLPTMRRLG